MGSWCGSVTDAEPVVEENDAQPPQGARVCRRRCTAVDKYAHLLRAARVGDVNVLVPIEQRTHQLVDPEPETYRGRPIEDVHRGTAAARSAASPTSSSSAEHR